MDSPEGESENASVKNEVESSPAAADSEESSRQDNRKRSTKKSLRLPPDPGEKKGSEGGSDDGSSREERKSVKGNVNSRKSVKSPGSSSSNASESMDDSSVDTSKNVRKSVAAPNADARKSVLPTDRKSVKPDSDAESSDKAARKSFKPSSEADARKSVLPTDRKSVAPVKPSSDAESSARQSRRRPNLRLSSSDSSLDESEISHIREMMKRKRSTREASMSDRGLGDSGPDLEGRFAALRMAVQHHDLPMQLAYEELDELADKAERVRSAINTNISILALEMKKSELRYMRSAFTAWKLYTDGKHARRLDSKNAVEYNRRRMMQRAFQGWRFYYLREQKFRRLQASAERLLRRHLLERIWQAWSLLVKKRLREDERHRREKQLVREIQEKQRETIGRRAVQAIRRRRLHWIFSAFKTGLEINRAVQRRYGSIFYVLTRNKMAKSFKFWKRLHTRSKRAMRAQMRNERKFLSRCFWHWEDEVAFQKFCKKRMGRRRLANAFGLWSQYMDQQARHKLILERSTSARLRRLFRDFRDGCSEMKWRERTRKRATKKCGLIRLRFAFQAWVCYMQMRAHKRMIRLEDFAAQLEKENQRTRSECDRLGRIVDSGEWDQQRVAELEQASQILSGERDALTKLVGRLERDRCLAMDQQTQQDMEIRHLKEQIMGSNFMHRNKLLVKGASSFNSVVRAVKSELLKKGVNPEMLYSIDNMAMDQVSVFPDGDLRVKPLSKFDKGKWGDRTSTDSTKAFMEELSPQPQPLNTGPSPRRVRDHTGVY